MPSKNKAGCTCCEEGGCLVHSDTFDRSDTTTIPNTTELVGNWANTSNALHPDHAASDQRLRFDDAFVERGIGGVMLLQAWQQITIRGQSGDRVGIGFVMDNDYDSWVEATVRFGTGTAGRINMNQYTAGVLDWTWNEELECAVNEYAIPTETAMQIQLCSAVRASVYHGTVFVQTWHCRVIVGSDEYRVGYANLTGIGLPDVMHGVALTGTDAITAYFDDYSFYGSRQYYTTQSNCPYCPTCEMPWIGDAYEEISGDWTFGADSRGPYLTTSDSDAIVLFVEEASWANDNMTMMWFFVPEDMEGRAPEDSRMIFSWVDADNYWYLELTLRDLPGASGFTVADYSLVERTGGSETVHRTGILFPQGARITLSVWDCTISLIGQYAGVKYCLENAALNNTGRWGYGTGATITTAALIRPPIFSSGVMCTPEFDCEDGPDIDPPDPDPDPDPGDPTGCCSDLDELLIGDTIECTIAGITYFLIAPCAGACGDAAFLTAMNATHNLECIYKSTSFMWFYGDTGLINTGALGPCDPYTPVDELETMKLWVKVTKVAADECVWQGMLTPSKTGSCLFFFTGNPDVTPIPATCSGWQLLRDTSHEPGEPKLCCLQGDSATLTLNFP